MSKCCGSNEREKCLSEIVQVRGLCELVLMRGKKHVLVRWFK